MRVVFSHGQDSGPWGTKIQAMARFVRHRRLQVDSLDYQGMEPAERVGRLVEHCRELQAPPALVGSSLGGHVAAAASLEVSVQGLFLLAPAFHMPGYEQSTPSPSVRPIVIVHGWRDDVVPADNSVRFAREHSCTLHLVDGDHRLEENLPQILDYLGLFLDSLAQ